MFMSRTPWYMGGKCDNKEGDLNWAHLFRRVLGHKRGSDITEYSIICRVYKWTSGFIRRPHGGVTGCHEAPFVQSNYTRGKPAVSHVPSWTMRWKGSLTALASVSAVVRTGKARMGMHKPSRARRMQTRRTWLLMRKCSEWLLEWVRRRIFCLQLGGDSSAHRTVRDLLLIHLRLCGASKVLWRWWVVMVGHPGVAVWGEPVVDWCFCCSSLSQLLGWHLLSTPLSR